MKRSVVLAVVISSLAVSAATATAAPKVKAKPKPVPVTLFLHGTQSFGEADNTIVTGEFPTMDLTAPTGTQARSRGVTNYGAGPNTKCAGNSLFPVWVGALAGTPTGDVTVDLFLQSAGSGTFEVRLFADIAEQACNDAYVEPIGSATFAIANGAQTAKIVLKGVNKKAKPVTSLMLQVSPATVPAAPFITRIQYDSVAMNSRITMSCLPNIGKKAC